MKAITEELCGHAFSASSISEIDKTLDARLAAFATRRLEAAFPHPILDARSEGGRGGASCAPRRRMPPPASAGKAGGRSSRSSSPPAKAAPPQGAEKARPQGRSMRPDATRLLQKLTDATHEDWS